MVFVSLEGAWPQQTTAGDPSPRAPQPSLSDPKHLWNRIRYRFHVRVESETALGPDKLAFDPNEHDPLHWSRIWFPTPGPIDYLLKGAPYQEEIALLDEFLTKDGEKLESDPLQLAFLQHDLWAVFDYVSDPRWLNPNQTKLYRVERRELYRRLATVIERLALTNEQIDTLPDNYSAAVAAKKYPSKFDPERPGQAFLPSPPSVRDSASCCLSFRTRDLASHASRTFTVLMVARVSLTSKRHAASRRVRAHRQRAGRGNLNQTPRGRAAVPGGLIPSSRIQGLGQSRALRGEVDVTMGN
jgi:hypothetical protein